MTDYKMLQGVPYNILPANVLLAEDITSFEKLLYTEILALSNRAGYCWAENKHFATVFKIHITNISKSINNLKAHNYIAVTFLHKGINNVQRRIFINHQKFTDWLINEKKQQHLQYSELDDYKSAEELGLDSLVEGDTEKITPPLSENTKLDFTSLAKTPNYYFSENTKLIINHTNKALKYINILIKGNGDQKTEKETELNNKIFSVNNNSEEKWEDSVKKILDKKVELKNCSNRQVAQIILWYAKELRGKRITKPLPWIKKIENILQVEKIDFTDLIEAMWRLEHNAWMSGRADKSRYKKGLPWHWDLGYIFGNFKTKSAIEIGLNRPIEYKASGKALDAYNKIKHLCSESFNQIVYDQPNYSSGDGQVDSDDDRRELSDDEIALRQAQLKEAMFG